MSEFEMQEELQKSQQRFEAALKFATTDMEYGDKVLRQRGTRQPSFDEAITMADELIAKLEAPMKVDSDTPF